jgi:hypothetical protein
VGTIPKSNIKIVERGKIDIPKTQIHDYSLSWLGTDTSIKSGGVKLVFHYASKMPALTYTCVM